jgi:hypothetical protein
VLPASYQPIIFFVLPPGGFLVFALFISLNLFLKSRLRDTPADDADTAGVKAAGTDVIGTESAEGHRHGGMA